MTSSSDISRAKPEISFEFFPPKGPTGAMRLWRSVERLAPLAPSFVSVTYGAGGATRDRTMAAIMAIRDRARLDVAGHLTCVDASREETLKTARVYAKLGCRRIVALRGDPPKGASSFQPHPDGFASSVELVEALARIGNFDITVGAYPEKHPEAANSQADIDYLKRKIDAGAHRAITQFFFDNEAFLRFRDACADAGITAPIIPGVMPIENFAQIKKFADSCGARTPDWMIKAFANADCPEMTETLATAIATEQCDELLSEGVERLHFYTLNNPDLPYSVCRALGVEPRPVAVAAAGGCG